MALTILANPLLQVIGLTVIRVGIGIIFTIHGMLKIKGGIPEFTWLGQQMGNLGITCCPLFWGICAMLAELLGGLSLVLGFGTRLACLFLIFVMIVAACYHLNNKEGYMHYSFALSQIATFMGLLIAGSGIFSLDHYFGLG